jgi:hypothetical protein
MPYFSSAALISGWAFGFTSWFVISVACVDVNDKVSEIFVSYNHLERYS